MKKKSSGMNNSELKGFKTSLNCSQEERESFARETLLSITDAPENEKNHGKTRESYNTSQITCWNQNYLNILNRKEVHSNRKKYQKFRTRLKKQTFRDNSFLDNQTLNFSLNHSIKKEIENINCPLREKTMNSPPNRSFEGEKERTKTKNEILLEIISCKQEITSMMKSTAKKSKHQWKCFSVAKERDETRNYQRIKRKDFSSNQNQNEQNMIHIPKGKSLFVNKTTYKTDLLDLRGKSIKKLFAE